MGWGDLRYRDGDLAYRLWKTLGVRLMVRNVGIPKREEPNSSSRSLLLAVCSEDIGGLVR
jgi:hypothetical protein